MLSDVVRPTFPRFKIAGGRRVRVACNSRLSDVVWPAAACSRKAVHLTRCLRTLRARLRRLWPRAARAPRRALVRASKAVQPRQARGSCRNVRQIVCSCYAGPFFQRARSACAAFGLEISMRCPSDIGEIITKVAPFLRPSAARASA